MTKYCKEHNIESFSRNRGGWFKEIERFDKYHPKGGGWCFVGSKFTKVGNFDSKIKNGLYIDCSKKEVDGKVQETINLFEVDGETIKLLETKPKAPKWAYEFYDIVEKWFSKEDNTVQKIIDAIDNISDDKEKIREAFEQIIKNDGFRNKYEVLSILQSNNVAPIHWTLVEKYAEDEHKLLTRDKVQKYKGGYALSDDDLNAIGFCAVEWYDIDLKNCKVVAESIEPWEIRTQKFYEHLEALGDTEENNWGKTVGYYYANKRHNRNGVDNRYNILFMTCCKETNTIYLKYCDIWVDWMHFW